MRKNYNFMPGDFIFRNIFINQFERKTIQMEKSSRETLDIFCKTIILVQDWRERCQGKISFSSFIWFIIVLLFFFIIFISHCDMKVPFREMEIDGPLFYLWKFNFRKDTFFFELKHMRTVVDKFAKLRVFCM